MTNMELLEATFNAMDAPNSLLYSSDWPHWDFDVPGRMMAIPFLSDHARRNILGETARKIFDL
jgi:predicted TIM-barrel fold metal-dependent hydrolase